MNWNPPGTPKPPKTIHYLKRSPIKKNPNYRIPKISKKKAKQLREERPLRKQLLEKCQGICADCGKFTEVHPHHDPPASRGGILTIDSPMVCNPCHAKRQGNVLGLRPPNLLEP